MLRFRSFFATSTILTVWAQSEVAFADNQPSERELRVLVHFVESLDRISSAEELARLEALYPDWSPPEDLSELISPSIQPRSLKPTRNSEVEDTYTEPGSSQFAELVGLRLKEAASASGLFGGRKALPDHGDVRIKQVSDAAKLGDLAECLLQSEHPQSGDLALERAWCALGMERVLEAIELFGPLAAGDGQHSRDAKLGLATALVEAGRYDEASEIVRSSDFGYAERSDLLVAIVREQATAAFTEEDFRRVTALIDQSERQAGHVPLDLKALRAQALMRLGNVDLAKAEFESLRAILPSEVTNEALLASR